MTAWSSSARKRKSRRDEERLIMRESDVFGVVEAAEKAKPASA
jgi:co-chaperonin GroES (HSP10)